MPVQWRVVGQQRHAVVEHRRDDEGELFVKTGCGWHIWPSKLDARLRDVPVCAGCAGRYGEPESR